MPDLSDLENAVLGIVWRDGPCTAYAVRRDVLDSPSPAWSGSAGAIYPLIRRLEQRGLLLSAPAEGDGRRTRRITVSAQGLRALRGWLTPPLPPAARAAPPDPIRTRLFFLDVLGPAARGRFLAETEQALADQVDHEHAHWKRVQAGDDALDALAARGALLQSRARLTWIREVRAALG